MGALGVNEMRSGGKRGTNAVEVETITEHQLPEIHLLDFERLDRAEKGETKLKMMGDPKVRPGKTIVEPGELTEAV
jgi:hypothetical protein